MSIFTIISNNNNAPTSSIVWADTETTENRAGVFSSVEIHIAAIADLEGNAIYSIWQINTGSGFVDNIYASNQNEIFPITSGIKQFRLKNTDSFGAIGYSNILQYSNNASVYDNFYNYFFEEQGCDFPNMPNQNISFGNGHTATNQLGLNYTGALPSNLRILSYTSMGTYINEFGVTTALPYTPPTLTTLSNVPITYPYNIPMSSFSVSILPIKVFPDNYINIVCPPSGPIGAASNQIIDVIEYEVFDINGVSGGVKTSNVISSYVENGGISPPPPPPPPPNPTYPLTGYNVCFHFTGSDPDCGFEPQSTITYINVNGQIQTASGPGCPGVDTIVPILVHQIISGGGAVTIC